MARIRSIKPTIWDSEQFADVSYQARLTFIGLITQADDDGRLKGSARWVKSKLFSYDPVTSDEVDGWLTELSDERLIIRFEHGGKPFIELPTWHTHQKINRKTESALPSHSHPDSLLTHDTITEPTSESAQEWKGREGKGEEGIGEESSVVPTFDAPLSELLADLVAGNDPNGKRPNVTKTWATEEDRMVRLDERNPVEAERLIRWVQNDSFWRGNILSMPKFREKYGQLYQAAVKDTEKRKAPGVSHAERFAAKARQLEAEEQAV